MLKWLFRLSSVIFIFVLIVLVDFIFFAPIPQPTPTPYALDDRASIRLISGAPSPRSLLSSRRWFQGALVDIPEFEVLFASGASNSGDTSYGVMIETPNEVDQAVLKLNELLLEARGGTSLIWRGDVLADVDALENADNTSETALKRRPERWDMTVASGIVKARANQAETSTVQSSQPLVSNRPLLSFNTIFRRRFNPLLSPSTQINLADYSEPFIIPQGVGLRFSEDEGLSLQPISEDMALIGNSAVSSERQSDTPPFNSRQIQQLSDSQTLLRLLPDLSSANQTVSALIPASVNLEDNTPPSQPASNILEVMISAGVPLSELANVLENDPTSTDLLINAIMTDPSGFDALQTLATNTTDPTEMGNLFASIAGSDPIGVDLFLVAASVNDSLTAELNTLIQANPALSNIMVERLSTSPAALDTVIDRAVTSPNTLAALASIASVDTSPIGLGASILLSVVQSSPEAQANFNTALQSNPIMLANIETISTNVTGFTDVLSTVGVNTDALLPAVPVQSIIAVQEPVVAPPPLEVVAPLPIEIVIPAPIEVGQPTSIVEVPSTSIPPTSTSTVIPTSIPPTSTSTVIPTSIPPTSTSTVIPTAVLTSIINQQTLSITDSATIPLTFNYSGGYALMVDFDNDSYDSYIELRNSRRQVITSNDDHQGQCTTYTNELDGPDSCIPYITLDAGNYTLFIRDLGNRPFFMNVEITIWGQEGIPTFTPIPSPTLTPIPSPTLTPIPSPTLTPIPSPTLTPIQTVVP